MYTYGDTLLPFRIFKHDLRHLHFLSNDLDNGNVCPACPKVVHSHTHVSSFDQIFFR